MPALTPEVRRLMLMDMRIAIRDKRSTLFEVDRIIADRWGMNADVVARIRRSMGTSGQPQPVVDTSPVPYNERGFQLGVALGGLQVSRVSWGKNNTHPFIRVGTETNSLLRRNLFIVTFGQRGEIHHKSNGEKRPDELSIYLDDANFSELLNPEKRLSPPSRFFRAKNRMAPPLIFGFMGINQREREEVRLSRQNRPLLKRMNRYFEERYGFSLGRYLERDISSGTLGKIVVTRPGDVLAALMGEESVRSLPYFAQLSQLDQPDLESRMFGRVGNSDRFLV